MKGTERPMKKFTFCVCPFAAEQGLLKKEGITVNLRMHFNVATQSQEQVGNQEEKAAFLFSLVPEFAASVFF